MLPKLATTNIYNKNKTV